MDFPLHILPNFLATSCSLLENVLYTGQLRDLDGAEP